MKATLEFDLDERFDKEAHTRAVKATEAYLVIFHMHEKLVRLFNDSDNSVEISIANKLLTELNDEMERYGISFNDIS